MEMIHAASLLFSDCVSSGKKLALTFVVTFFTMCITTVRDGVTPVSSLAELRGRIFSKTPVSLFGALELLIVRQRPYE